MDNNFIYKDVYSHLTNVCLNLTDACNLACRYCFVAQKPHYMAYQVAQDSMDWLIANKRWKESHNIPLRRDDGKIKVTFFGGEPTLLWDDVIVPTVQYCNQKYPNEFYFSITTNGTLLTEDKLEFMRQNNFGMLLSIDGAPDTQNFNRPCHNSNEKSFDLVIKNIPAILKSYPRVTFRSTIAQETVDKTFENYIFAQYLGFKNMFMIPNSRESWSDENLQILEEQFKRIYMYMIDCFQHNKMPPISFTPINESFTRIKDYNEIALGLRTKKERQIYRCGLGTGLGSIGYDGSLYGCQEQDSKGPDSQFYFGNIYTGIDKDKHFTLLKNYMEVDTVVCGDNPTYCNNCPLAPICGELNCPSLSYDLFSDFNKDSYVHCYWLRLMNDMSVTTLRYLEDNETFKQYLIKYCDYEFLKKENE